jgi:hypothetical protein
MLPVHGGETPLAAPAAGSPALILPHLGIRSNGANSNQVYFPTWSGYIADGETYTRVQAAWTVPYAHCGQNGLFEWSKSTTWVGLGGTPDSHPLEQVATESECHNGIPNYYAWTEMYHQEPEVLPITQSNGTNYPVSPGDQIFAYVQANSSGTSYTMWLTDETKGWSGGAQNVPLTTGTPAQAESTAEWITEFGGGCGTCTYLTDFGAVFFTAASAVGSLQPGGAQQPGVISSFPNYSVWMGSSSNVMAEVFSLIDGGTSFEDLWLLGT